MTWVAGISRLRRGGWSRPAMTPIGVPDLDNDPGGQDREAPSAKQLHVVDGVSEQHERSRDQPQHESDTERAEASGIMDRRIHHSRGSSQEPSHAHRRPTQIPWPTVFGRSFMARCRRCGWPHPMHLSSRRNEALPPPRRDDLIPRERGQVGGGRRPSGAPTRCRGECRRRHRSGSGPRGRYATRQ